MKKLILMLFLLLTINIVEASKVYLLELNYDNDIINLKNNQVLTGYAPDNKLQPKTGYKLELISFNDKVLYDFNFEIPLVVFSDTSNKQGDLSGSVIKLKQQDFALVVPYFENAKEINIYDRQGVVLSIDVSLYSKKSKTNIIAGVIVIILLIGIFLLLKKNKRYMP